MHQADRRRSSNQIVITEDDEDLDLDALLLDDATSSVNAFSSESQNAGSNSTSPDPSSHPPLLLKQPPSISAVEEGRGPAPEWVLPSPGAPGDFLLNSIHKVPSKSILKKKSSYGSITDISSSSSGIRSLHRRPSFLGISSCSNRSRDSGRALSPGSPLSIGMDLDNSSPSQHNPYKKGFIDDIPTLPNLNAAPSPADVAAGATSLDFSSGFYSTDSADSLRRSVSFNSVAVREYDRTVGDNPSCRSGPPLSLDWSYSKKYEKSVDEFEGHRACERVDHLRKLHMNKYKRRNMLSFHWGHTEEEMKEARKQTKRVQMQRSVTKTLLPLHIAHEGLLSLKKMIFKNKSSGSLSEKDLLVLSRSSSIKFNCSMVSSGHSKEMVSRDDFRDLPPSTSRV
mmetsp:Transcript_17456/g.36478  ORF Transcript_17456/g.36478 Transcript_17456/m.36478 type:complete len:396 (+) Transcript_17456:80-1267(+)